MNQNKLSTYKWLLIVILILVSFSYFRTESIYHYQETHNPNYLLTSIILSIILFFVFFA